MNVCLLADNQFVTGTGIASLLREGGVETILRVETAHALQQQLSLYPEALVVLDYTLFDFVSVQQMLNVKIATPKSCWLLFSDELSEHFLRHVLVCEPAVSVVMKRDARLEVMKAVYHLVNRIPYVCESAEQILKDLPSPEVAPVALTASEKMILHEIALGKTTKEIAYEKHVSFHTVNSHRKNIFRKLAVNNLHEAIRYAIRAGIFDVAEYYI
jgi:DNA-binding NarL/FixJ family response regulator